MKKYFHSKYCVYLSLSAVLFLSACAGTAENYRTPAPEQQIPFTVEAVTPKLVSKLLIEPPPAAAPPEGTLTSEQYAYRIGPSDVLSLFVNQSLYGDIGVGGVDRQAESLYVVSETGDMFLPLHGALKVEGLTLGEAYAQIQKALAKFITSPQVNLRVAEYRSKRVAVAGAVGKPGYLQLTDRAMTITESIINAQQQPEADLRKVVLKRNHKEYQIDVFALMQSPGFGQNWILQDGDVVFVPKNTNRVYVLGEAPNHTEFIDPYSTSLAEVLIGRGQGSGGGRNGNNYLQAGAALPGSIFVIRGNIESARIFHLNGTSPESFILADQFLLASGDIVYVSTRPVTRFNRFMAQLLPSIQSVLGTYILLDRFTNLTD